MNEHTPNPGNQEGSPLGEANTNDLGLAGAPPPVMILLSIGTDYHQFPRIIDWLDAWLTEHPELAPHTLVQHGQSKASRLGRNMAFIPYDDLLAAMEQCRVVITHGGPATIFEARAHGVLPIAVPRRPELDEIVDHHQERFARHLAQDGLVFLCEDEETFRATLDSLLARPELGHVHPDTTRLIETMRNLDDLVERLAPATTVRARHERKRLVEATRTVLRRRAQQGI